MLGCVSIKWLVLFFNLGSKVLQLFGKLNSKRGLDIGVSFIYLFLFALFHPSLPLSPPFGFVLGEGELLLLLVEWEELQSSTTLSENKRGEGEGVKVGSHTP